MEIKFKHLAPELGSKRNGWVVMYGTPVSPPNRGTVCGRTLVATAPHNPEHDREVRRLIFVISRADQQLRPPLAKGQIWQLKHVYIQIVELGKNLLRFRMLDSLDEKGGRTQTGDIEVMWGYLRSRKARLLRGGSMA